MPTEARVNVLEQKYSPDNIDDALKPWEYARKKVPKTKSITSRFASSMLPALKIKTNNIIKTSFIVYKAYSIFDNIKILQHYYMVIDGMTWHPGFIDDLKIYHPDDTDGNVIKIEEICHFCLYHKMLRNFEADKKFNIITNNCQRITGHMVETALAIIYHVLLSVSLISGNLIFLIAAILIFLSIYMYNKLISESKTIPIKYCVHIKTI